VGLPGGKQGVYDYYITDHLGNVRMILTEEQHKAGDVCTMEETDAQIKTREEGQFGNPGAGNEVVNSRVNTPAAWRAVLPAGNTIKEKVSKLSAQGQKTGPNVLLKVMAGDLLHVKADYFYEGNSFSSGTGAATTLVNGLLTALLNDKGSQLGKTFSTDVSTQLNATQALTDLFMPQSSGGVASVPHAYINYIFFDEQFNYAGGDFVRVRADGNGTAPIARTNIRVPRNGWVYAYLSNESNEAVYFDNFAVTHERGRIVEESHYYPYGLKIAGISSRAQGKAENKYLYNGKELASGEFEDGAGLDWYEYGMREYDAQIGRFFRVDPLTDEYPYLTPYQYASCEPIANIDVDGLEGANATGAVDKISSVRGVQQTWLSTGTFEKLQVKLGYASSTKVLSGITLYSSKYVPQWQDYVRDFFTGAGDAFSDAWEGIKALPSNVQKPGWWVNTLSAGNPVSGFISGRFVDDDGNKVGFFDRENAAIDFIENADGRDWAKLSGRITGEIVKAAIFRRVGNATINLAPSSVTSRLPGLRGCSMCMEQQMGVKAGTGYRETFFDAHPDLKGKVVVHHAVEQQVLNKYPGIFTPGEIHRLDNLRGIPKTVNSDLHLSRIRKAWNKFYRANPNPSKQSFLDAAAEIDKLYGNEFLPTLKF
jgi:RHS repeat-associated protein